MSFRDVTNGSHPASTCRLAAHRVPGTLERPAMTPLGAPVRARRGGGRKATPYESTRAENTVVEIVSSLHDRLGLRPGRVYLLKPKSIPLTHNGKKRYGELKKRYLDGSLQATGRILFPEF